MSPPLRCRVAGVEWLFYHHQLNVTSTLEALSTGAIAVSMWWMVRERNEIVFRARRIWPDLVQNLKLGRWFFGSNMVFTVSSQCNPWVVGQMLGGSGVAAYAICESVVNIPRVALTSMQNIMAPMMARSFQEGGKPQLKALVKRLDAMLLWGSVVFAVGIAVLGPWVARVIFHSFPENGKTILLLLALNLVAFAATLAQSYGLTAIDKAGLTFYANIFGLVAQVLVSVWFVRHMQVPGAAASMLLGNLVVTVVRRFFYVREMKTA